MTKQLRSRLNATRRRWRTIQALEGSGIVFAGMVAIAIISFHSDRWFAPGTSGRQAWLVVLLASLAILLARFVAMPLWRSISDESVAELIERRYSELNERLLTTVELSRAGAAAGVSSAMVAQLSKETERMIVPLNFEQAIPTFPLRRTSLVVLVAAILLLIHIILFPGALSVWLRRMLFPNADIPVFARTMLWVTPEDMYLPRGEDAVVGVKLTGRSADKIALHYQIEGSGWQTATLAPTSPSFKMSEMQQSVTYYATANDGRSNPHTIHVEDRPTILSVKMKLDYPAYTGRKSEVITATAGNVAAPVGTRVEISATANKPLDSVTFVEDGKPKGPWRVDNETAEGKIAVNHDENYSLVLKDTRGFTATSPPQYTVRAQADNPPTVLLTKPGMDLERAPGGTINLTIAAKDDYGVNALGIAWRVKDRSGNLPIPGANGSRQIVAGGKWNLSSLDLKSGDVVTYEGTARDNDAVSGAHTGRSAAYRIHIVGAVEMSGRIDAQTSREQDAIRQLIKQQKAAQAKLEQARKTPQNTDLMKQAQSAQQDIAQSAANLAKSMEQTSQLMRDNNMAAQDELQRRDNSANTLRQLAQTSIPEAAHTIQSARTDPANRPNKLESAANQEQSIREKLEQVAQAQSANTDTGEMAQQAEKLAQEQQSLAEKAALASDQQNGKSPEQQTAAEKATNRDIAEQQAALRSETQALQRQVNNAARDAAEKSQPNAAALQQAAQQMHRAGITQKQAEAQQNARNGDPGKAAPTQEQAARDLRNLADALDPSGQTMRDRQAMQEKAAQYDHLAERLEQMGRQQSDAAIQMQQNPNAEATQKLSGQEVTLRQQANQIAPRLRDVPRARQTTEHAGQNMRQAQQQLSNNQAHQASGPASEAANQLQQAAQAMREAARQMQTASEAARVQAEVDKLAHDQRALEQQAHTLDEGRHGDNLTNEQQQKLNSIAQAQNQLAQRSQNLDRDMPSGSFKWALREATQRMWEANGELNNRQTGDETQRSQEHAAQTLDRISRSLAQRSLAAQLNAQSAPQNAAQAQMQQAADELQLAREMESQIRQETGAVDQQRNENPNSALTPQQQRHVESLGRAQTEVRRMSQRVSEQLRATPEISTQVESAGKEMEDVTGQLAKQQTGAPTQQKQESIISKLDQAVAQTKTAMREQRSQMAQSRQRENQNANHQAMRQSNPSARTFAPIEQTQAGAFGNLPLRGRGFGDLSPRAQSMMREGRQERVPAEYRDLVYQYYKALSERSK